MVLGEGDAILWTERLREDKRVNVDGAEGTLFVLTIFVPATPRREGGREGGREGEEGRERGGGREGERRRKGGREEEEGSRERAGGREGGKGRGDIG